MASPKRLEGESFEDFKARRAEANMFERLRKRFKRVLWSSTILVPKEKGSKQMLVMRDKGTYIKARDGVLS